MNLIKKILEKMACKHKWEVHFTSELYSPSRSSGLRPIRIDRTLICKKCGKIKQVNL